MTLGVNQMFISGSISTVAHAAASGRQADQFKAAFEEAREHHDSVTITYNGEERTVVPLAVKEGPNGTLLEGMRSDGRGFRRYSMSRVENLEVNSQDQGPVQVLDTLREAARDGQCVNLRYQTAREFVMECEVEPRALRWHDGHLLLEAVKTDKHELRTFRVDRIEEAERSDTRFDPSQPVPVAGEPLTGTAPRSLVLL